MQAGTNIKKLLPSLALGVFITLVAAYINYRIHHRHIIEVLSESRIPGSHSLSAPSSGAVQRREAQPPSNFSLATRYLARLIGLTDDLATDMMFSVRGSSGLPDTRDRIAVVAVDDNSLQRLGSWPWSRRDVAQIIAKFSDAKVVGLDIVFDKADRTSLSNYVSVFDALYGARLDVENIDPETLDNDIYLSRELARTRTVAGTILHNSVAPQDKPEEPVHYAVPSILLPNGKEATPDEVLLKQATYPSVDIPMLRQGDRAPLGDGFMNLFSSPSGIVRNVPLLAHLPSWAFSNPFRDGLMIYPALPLEMARVALGGDGYTLRLSDRSIEVQDDHRPDTLVARHAIRSVEITRSRGEKPETLLEIPLSEIGEMEVSFSTRRNDFRVYPAWEVLAGQHDGAFKDKLVLFGGTISGVGSVVSSGVPVPGLSMVEAHAAMLATMIKRDFIVQNYLDNHFWQQIMILLSGLAVSTALIFASLGVRMLVSGLVLVGIVVGDYGLFFKTGHDVGITLPLLSTLAVLLSHGFANYLIIGRERRFIRTAFSLNVSPSILGYLEAHPDRLSSLQGENRVMTVMFSDIRGFTRISERMTAPDLARFLNEYFTPMSDIVMKNMGTVDKFMGDAIMAFWNAPADNPRHAQDAARSAIEMLGKLRELQEGWTRLGLPEVAIGCGINSGPMFAGYMGSEQRKNYTVMGDNVNIASRLEGLNKFYTSNILITDATRQLLGSEFHCRVVDKVRVSGKEEAVIIHELQGVGRPTEEESEELAAFARVFELYQKREFAAAESLLKELVFIRPCPLYKMYLDRLAVYLALPPPDDWDGTFAMTRK